MLDTLETYKIIFILAFFLVLMCDQGFSEQLLLLSFSLLSVT